MDNCSDKSNIFVPDSEINKQMEYTQMVASILSARCKDTPKAFVHTYGCQGNVSDSERIKGFLKEMGYDFTSDVEDADLVLFNTCAVREHAEDRVFGNVGALKPIKLKRPDMIIALCGCMMQQKHIEEKIKNSYPFVNIVFGTFAIHRFPEMLYKVLTRKKRVFETDKEKGQIAEGLPVVRDRGAKAWLPIMYGCNNFCSYCIVPYVRGRERSRKPEDIIAEAKQLIAEGAKDITLLGQNVNSYGNGCDFDMNFSGLLREINSLDGDFIIRFMTSHPKDCTFELIDTIAQCEKVAEHLHLPFQSGNDRVLKEMNRKYTREKYLSLIKYAKDKIPDISITSDIIVGFPGETYEEFCDTKSLIEEAEFTSLFTFIYSKRKGTVAAEMDDPVPYSEKSKWFKELCDLQESIASKRTASMVGKIFRVLVEKGEEPNQYVGRTRGNISILFEHNDDSIVGEFKQVEITQALTWILKGRLI